MKIANELRADDLCAAVGKLFELASAKTLKLSRRWDMRNGAPVVTAAGQYVGRAWTQWTQGFAYGNAILCFEATGVRELLDYGRAGTVQHMAGHLTHAGVHDHGFNNLSTYGQLRRLMQEGTIDYREDELRFYELAIKVSGAVQASRWTDLPDGRGYIYSFNGAHSLFIDTMRTIRICSMAHRLGHTLLGEQDRSISLLGRMLTHARTTSEFNLFYGAGRDAYDLPQLRGRTAHEAIFNVASGSFRCPSSQQGYSPFTTWTRGLAWAMLGYAEELEFIQSLGESSFTGIDVTAKADAVSLMIKSAQATCDFYMDHATASDGICYWDTGAPELYRLGDWQAVAADPYNSHEPVDASASAIAAQGLIRLGRALGEPGEKYYKAGLTVARTLLQEPYLAVDDSHEGILLHSVYHRPNGWDYMPPGANVPYGESSMWGDYHLLELGLLLSRIAASDYYTFFSASSKGDIR